MKIVAYDNHMRQKSGMIVGSFQIDDPQMKPWINDSAEEDGSIHVDTLMDLAHDQEKLDLIEFLMSVGLHTDYVFQED